MKQVLPYFSQNPLDRLDALRSNQKKIEALKDKFESKYILYDSKGLLVDKELNCFFDKKTVSNYIKEENSVLLGKDQTSLYFCLHIKEDTKYESVNLRDYASKNIIPEEELGILAQAISVQNWHISHQFCSSCGEKSVMTHSGWRRDCPACKKEHFPRTDPVVIMLVTHGEYCLLGRGVHFLPNRFSCLAGYMESGESIEEASRRELFEEAGIIGEEVKYISSQPWPFPMTLMIGVHVKVKSKELKIDTSEIAEAKWVHKDDIKKILSGDESYGISTPKFIAIARNLLEWWVS